MKKKILMILLSALLAFSAFVPLTGAQAASFEPDAQRVINFVKTFSFMNELTVEDMQNKTPLTRAQLATVVSRIIVGENEIPTGEIPFTDVPEWAQPQVYFVYKQGIMIGDGEGRFMPDEMVTYGQAAKILVHLLGYDAEASKHAYPIGYMQVADKLGLTDGMDAKAGETISRYDVAKMLYQAVGVEVLNIASISNKRAELVTDGRDYLAVYLGIKSDVAVLGAINGKTAVKDITAPKGTASFGDVKADVADSRYDALLGCRVRYFLKSEGDDSYELVYMEEHKKNTVTRVKSSDVLIRDPEFSMTNFVYNETDDEKGSLEIGSEFCYSYNGLYDFDFEWDAYTFVTGYVDLIDHEDDGVIDVVTIWNFDEIVVDKVSEKVINGIHLDRFDLAPYGDRVTVTFPDGSIGNAESISQLKMWDVVSIAKSSDGKSVSLIVCRDAISGMVEEQISTSVNAFVIGGREYDVSQKFTDSITMGFADSIEVGREGEFYFNVIGEIAGIRAKKSDTELQYGFLLGVNEPKGMRSKVEMLIIQTSGKKAKINTKAEIYYTGKDGTRSKEEAKEAIFGSDLCPGGVFEAQLIRYRLNEEGEIAEVECALEPNTVMFDKDNFSKDYHNSSETFFFNNHAYGFASYDDDGSRLFPEFYAGGTTVIYYIPVEDGSIVKDDAKTISVNYFVNGGQYKNVSFYDNDETMVPSVIVYQPNVTEVSATFKESDNLVIVDKLVRAVNTKGEVAEMLKCWTGGSYQTLEIINEDSVTLNYGDIIFPKFNADGVLHLESENVIFRNNGRHPLYYKENHMSANPFSECWSANGIIYRKNETNLSVYCGSTSQFLAISLGRNKPLVYVISKNGNVRIGSTNDLVQSSALRQPDGTVVGEFDGSKVLINSRIDYAREIFIFEE